MLVYFVTYVHSLLIQPPLIKSEPLEGMHCNNRSFLMQIKILRYGVCMGRLSLNFMILSVELAGFAYYGYVMPLINYYYLQQLIIRNECWINGNLCT